MSFPVYHSQKHPSEMNRREKREYKRWLAKHQLWDGYFVSENHRKHSEEWHKKHGIKN